ncbi:MAG: YmaF family protein [Bacillota bacterium]
MPEDLEDISNFEGEKSKVDNKDVVVKQNIQTHDHEFTGSTMLAEECDDRHNHRFASVSSQVITTDTSHVHATLVNTDFFDNHHHEIGVITGPAIPVSATKHVHFVNGNTTLDDGHFHQFQFATLILSPLTV